MTMTKKLRRVSQAGNFVREEILSSFIRLVCHTSELQYYTAQRLFVALSSDLSQDSLTLAAVWVIGEFGDVLLQGGTIDDAEEVKQVRLPHFGSELTFQGDGQ